MRTTVAALVIVALLVVDWLTFHDLAEPHTAAQYLMGIASVFAIALLAQPVIESIRRRV